ncbi:DegQ family serine endoprotease [Caenispirillum bisanense]|uniref:Probable periplasmic serine endoprotease DegP-like n=1 Tax=Caenispirillum bisanense TaxID=414052 RepID=A0A286GYG0_9PROT|nr:DegQ family serine endoprotease [Caenispirillum bisanense]SOE00129.1 serine protease Do [Caenispirillum bisanense]
MLALRKTAPIGRTTGRSVARFAAAAGVGLIAWTQVAVAAPMPESLSGLVDEVSPAVVTITAEKTVTLAEAGAGEGPGMPFPPGSPLEKFFRQFGGPGMGPGVPEGRGGHAVGLGSGFLIGADGYVVTNNHVIDGAEDVHIALTDGTTLDAEIVGTDPKTDLALLKVTSDKDLPYVEFGDSDTLKVGDWVMAVGNPFGLGGTVTAGIVSARGRAIGNSPLDDFIQTDASINKGNSGGPMFDMSGKVVGVNSAIYSPNGGSVGIGFAVPAAVAKPVIAQLKENGHVTRGWLGVQIQPVTPEIAEAMGIDATKGALVSSVGGDTPAGKAGVETGDVITAVNGEKIAQLRDLPRIIAAHKPGDEVTLGILRGGDTQTVAVDLGTMPDEPQVAAAEPGIAGKGELGLALAPLDEALRNQLGLDGSVKGAVVANVDPTGPAAERGVRQGDVITRVGSTSVESPKDVIAAVGEAKKQDKKSVLLLVQRDSQTIFVPVPLRSA